MKRRWSCARCSMFDVMNEKNAHKEMKNEEKIGKRLSCTSPY